ncbi:UbiA family prenyltransferase [Pseudoxanthobacter soli]|uniref:UbiA family prenyltransferase n=1 Tax=Pseudoxanthobacter soli TaxID=433840 RepID=UPI000937BF97|nr:UbiA family prenyltransferase [Pseudoxanthobacter soli]
MKNSDWAGNSPQDDDTSGRPIVVDLDGTLVRSDLLIESFLALLGAQPFKALAALKTLRQGKANFKSRLADEAVVEIETLPFNEDVLVFLKAEHARGRPIYIASASDRRYVEALAGHLGFFTGVFGSENGLNLAGEVKAQRLCEAFGEKGFDYIGDAAIDEAVWRRAHSVYIANADPRHLAEVRAWAPEASALGMRKSHWHEYVRAIRVHQWLKNLLVFVPALAAHELGPGLGACILAFLSFSLCASSVYILNDLLDLRNDRAHARKKERPFAAGRIPLLRGALLFPVLLGLSFLIALFLPWKFLGVLAAYYALTCAYSFTLKRKMLVDVVALACLYGTRLWAGAAAVGLAISPWLMAFAIFIFLCLALVKRCSELIDRMSKGRGDPVGRGYRLSDLPALQSMAAAAGYVSVLVLALYFNSDVVVPLYAHPNWLWVICVLLLFWISRVLLLTHRGEMHDDPVVFAATDRISQMTAVACGLVIFVSQ